MLQFERLECAERGPAGSGCKELPPSSQAWRAEAPQKAPPPSGNQTRELPWGGASGSTSQAKALQSSRALRDCPNQPARATSRDQGRERQQVAELATKFYTQALCKPFSLYVCDR